MRKKLLITIDGPAGAGKSSVSRALARILSYLYLDTGALYRAVAYKLIKENKDPGDVPFLTELSRTLDLNLEEKRGFLRVILDSVDITDDLRTEELGLWASRISTLPVIRDALLPIQRQLGIRGGIIAEGRDMGTIVFPDAEVKFFLSADLDERIRRRHEELREGGYFPDLEEIRRQMILRDRQDTERSISPLRIPVDAVFVDSTDLSIEEVVAEMRHAVERKGFLNLLRA